MALVSSRLNLNRYDTALAGLQAEFPISGSLLPNEQAALASWQSKLAHALMDSEGTDVVTEIEFGVVNSSGSDPQGGTVTSVGAMT